MDTALVEASRELIRDALSGSRRPYVAVSGGKDSMTMAHLVLSVSPSVPLVHSIHGVDWRFLREIGWERKITAALRSMGAEMVVVERRNLLWVAPTWARGGVDCVFVGLRESESSRRRERMLRGSLGPIPEVWPLASWREGDVWSYIRSHGVPYPNLYRAPGIKRFHWPRTTEELGLWQVVHFVGT